MTRAHLAAASCSPRSCCLPMAPWPSRGSAPSRSTSLEGPVTLHPWHRGWLMTRGVRTISLSCRPRFCYLAAMVMHAPVRLLRAGLCINQRLLPAAYALCPAVGPPIPPARPSVHARLARRPQLCRAAAVAPTCRACQPLLPRLRGGGRRGARGSQTPPTIGSARNKA